MDNKDFIPSKDRDFLQWTNNFLNQLPAMIGRLGFPNHEYEALSSLRNDFSAKFTLAEEPATRTKVSVQNKNDSRAMLEKALRQDVKEYLNFNRALTDGDRDTLGLPVYKTGRTPAPVATKHPDYDVDSSEIRRLTIHFFEQGSKHTKAKPAGQHGAEIRWAILDTPPHSLDDLAHSSFDTHTPLTLSFDEYQRGKTVYFCLCWENTRGEKGPWSEIVSAIIP
jgi:hypothetical protein